MTAVDHGERYYGIPLHVVGENQHHTGRNFLAIAHGLKGI